MHKHFQAALAASVLLAVASAQAQTTPAPDSADPAARAAKMRDGWNKRFDAADVNHDGKLSREEAQAKMPRLAERFDEIDTAKTGFVTKAQVEASMQKRMRERKDKGSMATPSSS